MKNKLLKIISSYCNIHDTPYYNPYFNTYKKNTTINNDDKNKIKKYIKIGINYPFRYDLHDYFKSTLKNKYSIELYKQNPYLAKLLNIDELKYRNTELGITLFYIFEQKLSTNHYLPIELWIYIYKMILEYYKHSDIFTAPKLNDPIDKSLCTRYPRNYYK